LKTLAYDTVGYNAFAVSWQRYAIFVAPAVALAMGVWAEAAHLTPPVLFAVAVPAIIVSTLAVASFSRRPPWPLALVVAGALVGTITFGLAEGTHLAIHFSRGKTIDFGDYHSRAAIGALLIGIHLAAGALVGAGVGAGLAVLSMLWRFRSPTTAFSYPSPSTRERGRG
jgi:hypothetical protein